MSFLMQELTRVGLQRFLPVLRNQSGQYIFAITIPSSKKGGVGPRLSLNLFPWQSHPHRKKDKFYLLH